jgi:hypothetical protein
LLDFLGSYLATDFGIADERANIHECSKLSQNLFGDGCRSNAGVLM